MEICYECGEVGNWKTSLVDTEAGTEQQVALEYVPLCPDCGGEEE